MLGAPKLISAVGDVLVSIEELRGFLRLDDPDLDVEIAGYLAASIGEVERLTGYRLGRQTVEVVGDRWHDFRHLLVGPVREIVQVRYQDRKGEWQDLEPGVVELFGGELEQGVRSSFRQKLPPVRDEAAVIAMRFDVGSEVSPEPLKWAVLLLCRGKLDDTAADVDHLLLDYRINL